VVSLSRWVVRPSVSNQLSFTAIMSLGDREDILPSPQQVIIIIIIVVVVIKTYIITAALSQSHMLQDHHHSRLFITIN